ncbi:hypothetical protein GWK47_034000 [Chionoecetes opilio]|uniref:Uncharacterized protein n=1 Tax=Chionoecetes opilio TaxID=41210 RepID=A0A8J5CPB3_CHIOP|nr:hypothetical protein GWK47_034000 [Chionoecetes opilio]
MDFATQVHVSGLNASANLPKVSRINPRLCLSQKTALLRAKLQVLGQPSHGCFPTPRLLTRHTTVLPFSSPGGGGRPTLVLPLDRCTGLCTKSTGLRASPKG